MTNKVKETDNIKNCIDAEAPSTCIVIPQLARQNEVGCIHKDCEFWNELFDQNCSAETKNADPFVMYCEKYIPAKLKSV